MPDFSNVISMIQDIPFHVYDMAMYDGDQVFYHRFESCNTCNDSFSVAKAFVMTAAGMLVDEGKLRVSDRVCVLLDGLIPADADPAWKLVTVDHVLSQKIGFGEGFLDIDAEDASDYDTLDYLSIVFSKPLAHIPGSTYVYTDAAFYLMSRIISRAAGMNVDRYLMEKLFIPMKFREVAWSCCPQGYPIGATGLYISTRDMLKLAILYLHEGVYEGRRYLSREWVHLAIAREYEMHTMTASGLTGKGGMYGQAVLFSREHQCAFAFHSHEEGDTEVIVTRLDQLLEKAGKA